MMDKILAFIHIEKTAGTTISYILRSTYGIRHCGVRPLGKKKNVYQALRPWDLRFALKVHLAGLRSIAGHSVTPFADLEQVAPIQYFTFLRNPINQCVSYYQYLTDRHVRVLDFETWIQSEWLQNMQTKRIAGAADAEAAWQIIQEKGIFVGLMEHFDESLRLLKALFVPELNTFYQMRNTAPRQTIAKELLKQPEIMMMLQAATEEDRKLYTRVQQELFPHYRARLLEELGVASEGTPFSTGKENKLNLFANLAYRNLFYKPIFGIAERIRVDQ